MINKTLSSAKRRGPFLEDLSRLGGGIALTYWLLNLMVVFLLCQQNLDSPNIGQIGRHFGIDAPLVDAKIGGEAFMWQMIVSSAALVTFGYLADLTDRKKLLLFSVAVSGLSYLAAPMARNADQFIALRALAGIGIGGMVPVMFSLIGDIFPARSRAAAAGVFMAVANVGYGNGFILGSLIGAEGAFGWKASFYIQSVALLAVGLLLAIFGKYPARGQADAEGYEGRIRPSDLKRIFGSPTNAILIGTCVVATMPMGYIQRFLVDYLSGTMGLDAGTASLTLILVLSGSLLGDLAGGVAGDSLRGRDRRYPCFFSALAIFAGCAVFYGFFSVPVVPLAVPVAVGFIAAALIEISVPISKAIMLNVNFPENRGTVSALIQTTAQIGFGLGALISSFGPRAAAFLGAEHSRLFNFRLAVLLWVPIALSWLLLARTAPRDEDRTAELLRLKSGNADSGRGFNQGA